MDIDGWIKSMTQFSDVCGTSPINDQIIFFDGHDIHFNGRSLMNMEHQNIQPLVMKEGDFGKDHTNDNGPNYNLKYHCNHDKSTWMLKCPPSCSV